AARDGVRGWGRERRVRRDVHQNHQQLDAGDAVDEAVVDLGDERAAVAFDAVDEVEPPQRLVPAEPALEEPRGELAELVQVAGRVQAHGHDVPADIEVGIPLPGRVGEVEGGVDDALLVARDEVDRVLDVLDELVVGYLTLEHGDGADVHGRVFPLEVQEGG